MDAAKIREIPKIGTTLLCNSAIEVLRITQKCSESGSDLWLRVGRMAFVNGIWWLRGENIAQYIGEKLLQKVKLPIFACKFEIYLV